MDIILCFITVFNNRFKAYAVISIETNYLEEYDNSHND